MDRQKKQFPIVYSNGNAPIALEIRQLAERLSIVSAMTSGHTCADQ
jgi:hypothetical protein